MKENNTMVLKDGRKLGYAEYGDPKGKPLFFFHGWPGCRFRGHGFDKAAKKLGVRVISPDRPGYGLSTYKPNRKLLDWPDDVVELADYLELKKFAVAGISGGGPYAAVCAYKLPKKITKTGIIVGLGPSTIPGAFEGVSWMGRIGWENYARVPFLTHISALLYLLEVRYFPYFTSFVFRAKTDKDLLSSPEFKKDMLAISQEAFRQGSKGPALDLRIYTSDWGFKVKDISSEVLLWYGSDDRNVSLNMGTYYHSQIKKSKLTIYPNEGHLLLSKHAGEMLQKIMQ